MNIDHSLSSSLLFSSSIPSPPSPSSSPLSNYLPSLPSSSFSLTSSSVSQPVSSSSSSSFSSSSSSSSSFPDLYYYPVFVNQMKYLLIEFNDRSIPLDSDSTIYLRRPVVINNLVTDREKRYAWQVVNQAEYRSRKTIRGLQFFGKISNNDNSDDNKLLSTSSSSSPPRSSSIPAKTPIMYMYSHFLVCPYELYCVTPFKENRFDQYDLHIINPFVYVPIECGAFALRSGSEVLYYVWKLKQLLTEWWREMSGDGETNISPIDVPIETRNDALAKWQKVTKQKKNEMIQRWKAQFLLIDELTNKPQNNATDDYLLPTIDASLSFSANKYVQPINKQLTTLTKIYVVNNLAGLINSSLYSATNTLIENPSPITIKFNPLKYHENNLTMYNAAPATPYRISLVAKSTISIGDPILASLGLKYAGNLKRKLEENETRTVLYENINKYYCEYCWRSLRDQLSLNGHMLTCRAKKKAKTNEPYKKNEER